MQSQNISSGLLTLFITHTSASLLIQENAGP
ncbi:MAG: YjbQ family protein, partial [Nitrospinaceae bacterium]